MFLFSFESKTGNILFLFPNRTTFLMFLEKKWLDKPNPETLTGWKFENFFFFFPPSNQAFFKEKKKTIGIGTFYGDVLFGLDFLNKWFWAKRKGIREYITLRRTNQITKIASVFKVGVVNVKIIIWLMWQGAVGPLGRSGSPGLPGQPVMHKLICSFFFSVVSFCFQLKKAIYHFVASLISIRMPQMIRGCRKLDFSASNISNFDHGACGHVACVLFPSFAKYKTCSYLLICKLYLY